MSNLSTETTADKILSIVNFDVAENSTVYTIENDELIELDKVFSEHISSKKTKNSSNKIDFVIDHAITGPVRTTVVPSEVESANRRSKRTRTVLSHLIQ